MRVKGGKAARRQGGKRAGPDREGAGNQREVAPLTASRSPLTRMISGIRAVFGMPNYAAYCAHVAAHHPDRLPLTESEFFADYLRTRYEGGPTRCC